MHQSPYKNTRPMWKDLWVWPWPPKRSFLHQTTRHAAGLARMAARIKRLRVWQHCEDGSSVEVYPTEGFSGGARKMLRTWAELGY